MPELKERADKILRQAEASLRALIVEAASNGGGYDVIHDLTRIAEQIHSMTSNTTATAKPGKAAKRSRRGRKKEYPKFRIEGDSLVKVGWSKKGKKEYTHKAPVSVLEQVKKGIAKAGSNGREFTVDDIGPATDETGQEVPTYQVYLCVAYLLSIGFVGRNTRGSYSKL